MILSNFLDFALYESSKEEYETLLRRNYQVSGKEMVQYQKDLLPPFQDYFQSNIPLIDNLSETSHSQVVPNFIWKRLLANVLNKVPNQESLRALDIFIGQIPDYRVNACVIPRGSTKYMLLINSDLMLNLLRVSRIFAGSYHFELNSGGLASTELGREYARELLKQNFRSMFRSGYLPPQRLQSYLRTKASFYLTEFLELFVIAHELGHLINSLGHPLGNAQMEDFQADAIGYQIYRRMLKDYEREMPESIINPLFFAAPHMLFRIYTEIEQCYVEMNIPLEDHHPSPYMRSDVLRNIQIADPGCDQQALDHMLVHFLKLFSEPSCYL